MAEGVVGGLGRPLVVGEAVSGRPLSLVGTDP